MIKKDMRVVKHYHCNNSGGRLRNRSQGNVLQATANWIIARKSHDPLCNRYRSGGPAGQKTMESMLRYAPEADVDAIRERMIETLAAVIGTPNFAVYGEMARWVFDARRNAKDQGADVPDHMSFKNDSNGRVLPAPPGVLSDQEMLEIRAFNKIASGPHASS